MFDVHVLLSVCYLTVLSSSLMYNQDGCDMHWFLTCCRTSVEPRQD